MRPRAVDGPRAALWATVAAGASSAAAGALAGVDGAPLGAAVATGVVVLFFATGAVPLLLVGGETSRAGIGLLVLLMTYGLRLVAMLVALTLASRSGAVDVRWMALTLMACALVYVGVAAGLAGRSTPTL